MASLGHTGRRVVLGYTLNTQTLIKADEDKTNKALSKFTILCWVAFTGILGHRLDPQIKEIIFGECKGADPPQLKCGICTEKEIC